MKILIINKFYYLSGGAERYVIEWERLLRSRGHDVMIFSMRHPANFPCRQERFFLDRVRFDPDQPRSARSGVMPRLVKSSTSTVRPSVRVTYSIGLAVRSSVMKPRSRTPSGQRLPIQMAALSATRPR